MKLLKVLRYTLADLLFKKQTDSTVTNFLYQTENIINGIHSACSQKKAPTLKYAYFHRELKSLLFFFLCKQKY